MNISIVIFTGTDGIPRYSNLIFTVRLTSLDRKGVGKRDLEMEKRVAHVSKRNPVKIIDPLKTGDLFFWS